MTALDGPDFAFPMEDAPKDGSILRLLVKFDRKSAAGAFEDTAEPSWTIGTNNKANTGEDRWDIVGWSWEQDVFCHAHGATAIGWLPFHTESSEPAALPPPAATPSPPPVADDVSESGEFVLVPREPTEAMIDAARHFLEPATERIGRAAWNAMIAASPSPQHIGDAGGVEVTDALVQRFMDSLFGEYTDPGNTETWVSPNWMETKARVRAALYAALPPARVEAGDRAATIEECAKVADAQAKAQSEFQKSAYGRGDDIGGHGHWKAQCELLSLAAKLRALSALQSEQPK